MRNMRQIVAVSFSLLGLGACETRAPIDSAVAPKMAAPKMAASAPPPSAGGGGPLQSDAGAPTASDTATTLAKTPPEPQPLVPEAGVVPTTPVPTATSCDELAAGGRTGDIDGFVWQAKVAGGPGSATWTFISLGYGCGLKRQAMDKVTVVEMNGADCAAARAWATNARFLEILGTGDGCQTRPGDEVTESFEVYIPGTIGGLARKTSGCAEPTLELERRCFRALAERLAPLP
jgi:hypothetical protein